MLLESLLLSGRWLLGKCEEGEDDEESRQGYDELRGSVLHTSCLSRVLLGEIMGVSHLFYALWPGLLA